MESGSSCSRHWDSDEARGSENYSRRPARLPMSYADWQRFVALDPEVGLRKAGLSEGLIIEILNAANTVRFDSLECFRNSTISRRDYNDGISYLLAVLGRGTSRCRIVKFVMTSSDFEGFSPNSDCFRSLCANLSSNIIIEAVTILWGTKDPIAAGPKPWTTRGAVMNLENQHRDADLWEWPVAKEFCSRLAKVLRTNHTLTSINLEDIGMDRDCVRQLLFCGEPSYYNRPRWRQDVGAKLKALAIEVGKNPRDYAAISRLKTDFANVAEKAKVDGLQVNTTVTRLSFGAKLSEGVLNDYVDCVADFLQIHSILRCLKIKGSSITPMDAISLANALQHNDSLEELVLDFEFIGYDAMEYLLEPFSRKVSRDSSVTSDTLELGLKNTALQKLGLYWDLPDASLLARLIETNETLVALEIKMPRSPLCASGRSDEPDLAMRIVSALSKNETVQELHLSGHKRLNNADKVGVALIELIEKGNTGLKRVDLRDSGISHWQGRVDEELRINREYRHKLRTQPMVPPASGRIVLCGFQRAGKTTIRNTLHEIEYGIRNTLDQIEQEIRDELSLSCCLPLNMACERVMRMFPALQQTNCKNEMARARQKELAERTRGFDILVMKKYPPAKFVWDFAGQKEYYVFHDYLFPDVQNSCFLYVCGCTSEPGQVTKEAEMRDQFYYWMRFIASNSKASNSKGQSKVLPYIQFVLTKKDTVDAAQLDASTQMAIAVVAKLRKRFGDRINLSDSVEVINALEAADVRILLQKANTKLAEILKIQREYGVCQVVRSALDRWSRSTTSSTPIMAFDTFTAICEREVKSEAPSAYELAKLDQEEGKKAVLGALNDTGDVIYSKELDFIVVNPRWFGIGILGYLIDPIGGEDGLKLHHDGKGVVNRENLKRWLAKSLQKTEVKEDIVSVEELIKLMTKLDICFQVREDDDSFLFFPAVFDDAKKNTVAKGLRWSELGTGSKTVYIGRRLECQDAYTTILTPGFFPRLQVRLVNYIREQNWTRSEDLTVDRNFIRFRFDGQEIAVEHSEVDSFVDILVKSSKSFETTLSFIVEDLIAFVNTVCASPQGCPGVTLVQGVIQPYCVQQNCRGNIKMYHSVRVTDLEMKMNRYKGFVHEWPSIDDMKLSDPASELLFGAPESLESSASSSGGAGSSKAHDGLPYFYISNEDVRFQDNLKAGINVSRLKPFKLHLHCDGLPSDSVGRHPVPLQPGRDLSIKGKKDGVAYADVLKPVAQFLVKKVVGTDLDLFINLFFGGADMPTTDVETLQNLVRSDKAEIPSRQDIVRALEDRIEYTGCLKKLLNVEDAGKFKEDFCLSEVIFADRPGATGFLCDQHFKEALNRKLLKMHRKP